MTWLKQNWPRILLSIVLLIFVGLFFLQKKVEAYGECSEYGTWAMYDSYSNTCKCMSGYVFGKLLGQDYCVSGDSVCYDKYGYGSRYDSLSKSCECSYGYVLGKDSIGRTQCITENQACQNQYGYNAQSSFGDKCECRSGYEFTQTGSGLECKSCFSKYGLNSSYDYLSKQCECDDGYTLKDGQCVEKQNNVYFTLKELDTDNKEAIIKSDYDFRYYFVRYNLGCYSSSFRRYLNNRIVVNLGTDFDLDTWDRIVLQDDNETCDITYREKVDSSFSLEEDEEDSFYVPINIPIATLTPPINIKTPPKTSTPTPQTTIKCDVGQALSIDGKRCIKIPDNAHVTNNGKDVWLCNDGFQEQNNSCTPNENEISPDGDKLSSPDKEIETESIFIKLVRVFKFWEWFK